jgi:hypothetical protein
MHTISEHHGFSRIGSMFISTEDCSLEKNTDFIAPILANAIDNVEPSNVVHYSLHGPFVELVVEKLYNDTPWIQGEMKWTRDWPNSYLQVASH